MRTNQKGFGHILLLALLLAVAVVVFAGYRVWSANEDEAATSNTSQTTTDEDLTGINKELDRSESELDSGLDDTELNADIDSM